MTIREPNRNAINGRKDWIYYGDLNTIKIINTSTTIRDQGHGKGYTFITSREFTLFSCYSTSNDAIEDL